MTNHPAQRPQPTGGALDRFLTAAASGVAADAVTVIIVEKWLPIHLTPTERLLLLTTAVLLGLLIAGIQTTRRRPTAHS